MRRNKPIEIAICESAEFNVSSYPVPASFLKLVERSLSLSLSDHRRDVSDGHIRFRNFGSWIVTFMVSDSDDKVLATVLQIEMPSKVSATREALIQMVNVAKYYSNPVQELENALKKRR